VAFSPDGRLALTGSDDETARLWETATGKPVGEPLRHEGVVEAVAFSPDGRLALTGSGDKTARLWEVVPPVPEQPERPRRLPAWVHVRTRKAFNDQGVLVELTQEDWLRAWQDFDADGGAWEPPPDLRRWHLTQAADAEAVKDWFAAAFHLSRLVEKGPDDVELLRRLATAHANLMKWREAIADHDRILDKQSDDISSRRGRARAYAELHQWDRAIADWEQVLKSKPDDSGAWYWIGLAYLGRQDVAAYRDHCSRMLEQLGQTKDASAANLTAFLALLLPDAVPDIQPLVRLAERAHQSDPNSPDYLETVGAALYRAGHYAESVQRLNESASKREKSGTMWTQLFLAMSYHRLGQLTAGTAALGPPVGPGPLFVAAALLSGDVVARGWLENARKQAAGSSPRWQDEVQRQYLFAEAQALLGQPPR
jgi:tetratricopeptide (TPR) repeat protein